jgi:hypothetical protein
MQAAPVSASDPQVELLLLELARVHQWTAMYSHGHPFLRERVGALHALLAAQEAKEPSGVLLLGVARDKVLYRDRFFEARHPIVLSFAEGLYRHHVATIGFGPEATPDGLAAFYRCLRDLQAGKIEEIPEGFLQREGIRGICISPVNYRDILSRGIVGRDPVESGKTREEKIWRALLSDHGGGEGSGGWAVEELSEFPEVLPFLLRRMRAGSKVPGSSWGPGEDRPETVSKEVLQRMFQRLGQTLKALPEDRRKQLLASLEEGFEDDGAGYGSGEESPAPDFYYTVARSLAEGYSDTEFLELLAGILSLERKGGKRLLQAFRVIASGRDIQGSLVPLLETWSTEGHHSKEYYAGKTWQAVERLLLERTEDGYLGNDHSRFLESLSGSPGGLAPEAEPALAIDPALAPFLEPNAVRWKGIAVLLDLLSREWQDGEYRDLLAAVGEAIPWLTEEREFALLDRVLDAVAATGEPGSEVRGQAVPKTLEAADFRRIAEICLSGPDAARECAEGAELLVKHGARSADPLLDRLLVEPDKGMRRVLLTLLVRIGEPAVPFILERLKDLPWYFLRNLCLLLGEIGVSSTVPGLVRMLSHKEYRVRREAIQALGKLRATDPDAVFALGRILQAESLFPSPKEDPIRIDAASALSRIGGAEAMSYLHRGKASRRAAVREHCEALLRTKGKE